MDSFLRRVVEARDTEQGFAVDLRAADPDAAGVALLAADRRRLGQLDKQEEGAACANCGKRLNSNNASRYCSTNPECLKLRKNPPKEKRKMPTKDWTKCSARDAEGHICGNPNKSETGLCTLHANASRMTRLRDAHEMMVRAKAKGEAAPEEESVKPFSVPNENVPAMLSPGEVRFVVPSMMAESAEFMRLKEEALQKSQVVTVHTAGPTELASALRASQERSNRIVRDPPPPPFRHFTGLPPISNVGSAGLPLVRELPSQYLVDCIREAKRRRDEINDALDGPPKTA